MKVKNLLMTMILTATMLLGASNVMAQLESTICKALVSQSSIRSGGGGIGTGAEFTLTMETDEDGKIIITLGDVNGNNTLVRGANGIENITEGYLTIDGVPNTGMMTVQAANDTKVITLTPTGEIAPGAVIKFTSARFILKNTVDGNLWPDLTFEYIYGSTCPGLIQLETPTNIAIDADNVLTFDEVDGATSYTAVIYMGTTRLGQSYVNGSGEEISFPISGEFNVTVTATGDVATHENSEESEPIIWAVSNPDEKVTSSEYCKEPINPTDAGSAGTDGTGAGYGNDDPADDTALFTWGTNEDGSIVITIEGVEGVGHDGTATKFRAFPEGNLIVGGISGVTLFTKALANDNTQAIFTPIAGISIPRGTTITLNGVVPYQTANPSEETGLDNLWPTIPFSYTYGAGCGIILPNLLLFVKTWQLARQLTKELLLLFLQKKVLIACQLYL